MNLRASAGTQDSRGHGPLAVPPQITQINMIQATNTKSVPEIVPLERIQERLPHQQVYSKKAGVPSGAAASRSSSKNPYLLQQVNAS